MKRNGIGGSFLYPVNVALEELDVVDHGKDIGGNEVKVSRSNRDNSGLGLTLKF